LDQSPLQTAAQSNDLDLLIDRYIAPGILTPHGSEKQSNLPKRINASDTDSASTITSLVEKVRELESRLNQKNSASSWDTSLPKQYTTSETPGQFAKFKFFGESHWVNAIEPVGDHPAIFLC
jgi:hypothetical protein